jgi:DNA ligase-1
LLKFAKIQMGLAQITNPMLAGTCDDPDSLQFPVLVTPKLDGIRCLKINGRAVSRSFKPIRNQYTRAWIEANLPDGVDGEITVRGGTFSDTISAINRKAGRPDFIFNVFDFVANNTGEAYKCRAARLRSLSFPTIHAQKVLPHAVFCVSELSAFNKRCISEGYEGIIIRQPHGPYFCGRSTAQDGWMLKLKPFEDAEATIIDTFELNRSGGNRGELGGFLVRLQDATTFRLGYNPAVGRAGRAALWKRRNELLGQTVKFTHQASGAKSAPRFAKFVGFREFWDMDADDLEPPRRGNVCRDALGEDVVVVTATPGYVCPAW